MAVLKMESNKCSIGRGDDVILGTIMSGVAVCLWDDMAKAGGVVIVNSWTGAKSQISTLLDSLSSVGVKAPLGEFRCKLVGGPDLSSTAEAKAVFSQIMAELRVPIVADDFGGRSVRELVFYPSTGRLRVTAISRNEASASKRRVVVIDDSPTVRRLLAHLFNADPELEVVGQAEDGLVGWKLISELRPDVVTLDVHMPNMNGPTLLAELMDKLPLPVVMISSQRPEDGPEVLRCLELGAVDYIRKPALQELADQGPRICEIVKAAAGSRIQIKKVAARTPLRKQVLRSVNSQPDSRVLAIGASTGGTEAIKNFLLGLNNHPPATLVVQHIPPVFSRSFADRLNELCPFEVKEAADGDKLMQGRVLIAPGGLQMKLQRSGGSLVVRITDEAPVNRHKPSVDVLFDSVAAVIGPKSMGVILTGMGSDGAAGLLNIRKAGGRSLAQNEQSSVVFGMPKEAIRIGAAEKSGTIDELASWVDRWISQSGEVVKK